MGVYTDIFFEAAEIARQERHAGQTCSLWGKDPLPPRGPVNLHNLTLAWYAVFSSHLLANPAGKEERMRTLDFFIAERPELTDALMNLVSGVVFDNKRYALIGEPRHEVGDPRYWRIICPPTGEIVT
jgi:hypothetical protein